MTRVSVVTWLLVLALAGACVAEPVVPIPDATQTVPSPSSAPGSTGPAPSGDPVVAWVDGSPPPLDPEPPASAAVAAAPCASDRLEAGRASFDGAGGSLAGGLPLRDAGPDPCRLEGHPGVAVLDRAGRALRITAVASTDIARPVDLDPRVALPAEHADAAVRGLASLFLVWSNWCGPADTRLGSLALTMEDGGVIRVPMEAASLPRCDSPQDRSTISVGPFEADPDPTPTDPPHIPAEALRLTLVVPDQAVAGQVLRYVAVLSNSTAAPIDLRPCPAFVERLNVRGSPVVVRHVLPCEEVPVIVPGDEVRFAMEIAIPADLAPDPDAALVWSLDPYGAAGFPPRAPDAKVGMPVVAP